MLKCKFSQRRRRNFFCMYFLTFLHTYPYFWPKKPCMDFFQPCMLFFQPCMLCIYIWGWVLRPGPEPVQVLLRTSFQAGSKHDLTTIRFFYKPDIIQVLLRTWTESGSDEDLKCVALTTIRFLSKPELDQDVFRTWTGSGFNENLI